MTMTDGEETMTISTLDAKAALVVIDLQKGIVGMPVAHPIDGVIRNAVALAETFRARKLPVVLVNVDGPAARPRRTVVLARQHAGRLDRTHSTTQPAAVSYHLVTKKTRGAFTNTDLEKYLRANAVT